MLIGGRCRPPIKRPPRGYVWWPHRYAPPPDFAPPPPPPLPPRGGDHVAGSSPPPPPPPPPALQPQPASAASLVANKRYRPREILVEVPKDAGDALRQALARDYRVAVRETGVIELIDTRLWHLALSQGETVEAVLGRLLADNRVRRAQPNYIYASAQAESGGAAPTQYSLTALGIPPSPNFPSGAGVKIAVIDTCADRSLSELQGVFASFYDAIPPGAPDCAAEDHGTAVSALIGARGEVRGIATGASLLSVRALVSAPQGGEVAGTTEMIVSALDWAWKQKARIANLSFAGPRDPLLEREIKAAYRRGIVLIAAAGNGGPSAEPSYPAAYPEAIAVTAIDAKRQLYDSANRGQYISVAAPGVDLIVARAHGGYDVESGTSYAAATVSGVVAILLEKRPNASPEQIRAALQSTAAHLGRGGKDESFGFGLVDAKAAASFLEANVSP